MERALTCDPRLQIDDLLPVDVESLFDIVEKVDVVFFRFARFAELAEKILLAENI